MNQRGLSMIHMSKLHVKALTCFSTFPHKWTCNKVSSVEYAQIVCSGGVNGFYVIYYITAPMSCIDTCMHST